MELSVLTPEQKSAIAALLLGNNSKQEAIAPEDLATTSQEQINNSPLIAVYFQSDNLKPKNDFELQSPRSLSIQVAIGKDYGGMQGVRTVFRALTLKPLMNFGVNEWLYNKAKEQNPWLNEYEEEEVIIPYSPETPELSSKISGYSDDDIATFVKRCENLETLKKWQLDAKTLRSQELIGNRIKELGKEFE